MAYYKKASYRYRRSRYGRRYSRRRRFYRRSYGRRYRRRKSYGRKVEYKRIEFAKFFEYEIKAKLDPMDESAIARVMNPFSCYVIGTGEIQGVNGPVSQYGVNIAQGTAPYQRIGKKINPARLKLFGTMAVTANGINPDPGDEYLVDTTVGNAINFAVRVIVFQIRNGDGTTYPFYQAFSKINPYIYGNVDINEDVVWNPDWFDRMLIQGNPELMRNGQTNTFYYNGDSGRNLIRNFALLKCPFRRGLGGEFRVLKDKVYTFCSGGSTMLNFKFKTKKPTQMVWREAQEGEGGANAYQQVPKNPIYIVFIPVGTWYSEKAHFTVNLSGEFIYSDL